MKKKANILVIVFSALATLPVNAAPSYTKDSKTHPDTLFPVEITSATEIHKKYFQLKDYDIEWIISPMIFTRENKDIVTEKGYYADINTDATDFITEPRGPESDIALGCYIIGAIWLIVALGVLIYKFEKRKIKNIKKFIIQFLLIGLIPGGALLASGEWIGYDSEVAIFNTGINLIIDNATDKDVDIRLSNERFKTNFILPEKSHKELYFKETSYFNFIVRDSKNGILIDSCILYIPGKCYYNILHANGYYYREIDYEVR